MQSALGGDSAVALMDSRRSTNCHDDAIVRLTGAANVGSVLANGACSSEIAVLSDDNAMVLETPVTGWTNQIGDVVAVPLAPIIQVPVSVWLALPNALARAQNDFANASLLYNRNNVGIQFVPTYNDVSGNPAAVATIGTGCGSAGSVLGSAFFTANRLNAYYVNDAFTGVNCGANRNLNYIGTIANLGSLAHEFGHAYSLAPSDAGGHTNGLAGFGNNNIMWGGGPGTRDSLSIGQAFRINANANSVLNTNGERSGPTRSCPPLTTSATCPPLALDQLPH